MHKGGWKPFWAALGAALLVLLPLVGGTVLLTRQMLRQQWLMQTAEPQRGVPIDLPKADDRMTLLLCTAGEQPGFVLFYLNAPQNAAHLLAVPGPGFVLFYLNAPQNAAHLLAVPGQLTVPFGDGEASLAQCYAAAGPARCRQALLETLALPEDTLYLALSPAVLETLAARYGAVRVSLSGALTAEELDALGQSPSVQTFRAQEASDLLTGLDADGLLPPSRRAAARAAVWDAFFRQNFELLPATLPEALRSQSSALLTDFAAQDYTLLGDILEFLVNRAAVFQSDALPGAWDRKAGTYTVTEASRAAVQTFLNVSPTEGQASSASEP